MTHRPPLSTHDSPLTTHQSPLRVAIYYNLPSRLTPADEAASEAGVLDQTEAFRAALAARGHEVHLVGVGYEIGPPLAALQSIMPDVVVNFCEAFAGSSRLEAPAGGLLELLGLPYTGAPADAISLLQNKPRTSHLLRGAGLPTPDFVAIDASPGSPAATALCSLQFPVILKPACGDASIGLDQHSVVTREDEYQRQLTRLLERHGPPVLVERYIPGREFDVAVIDDPEPRALPVSEIVFSPSFYRPTPTHDSPLTTHHSEPWPILTYEAKWNPASDEYRQSQPRCPAEVDSVLACRLQDLAVQAYRATGCRDYARVDFRTSPAGEPYLLEVNPNPDLSPTAGFALALQAARIDYADFADHLVRRAAARGPRTTPMPTPIQAQPVATPASHPSSLISHRSSSCPVTLRALKSIDRPALADLLDRASVFRRDEIEVALELIDEAFKSGPTAGYHFVVAARQERVVGYACFGPVPMTHGVWDLYWIVVDPAARGMGVATRLQEDMETQIRAAGGRLLLAETSSTPPYEPAHRFYRRVGYELLDRIPDFYRPGDHRLTFAKKLA